MNNALELKPIYKNIIVDVYDENPYIIAILSTEGRNKYEDIIKDINMKIYELNKMYNSNRESACHSSIYK